MVGPAPIVLSGGRVRASVLASEGGVVETLLVDDRPALARTPWADDVALGPEVAATEADWVARWRGGWQLCFPSTGQPEPDAAMPQGFHGVASQAVWEVLGATSDQVRLRWEDDLGLRAERTWRLTDDGIEAATDAINDGRAPRPIAVAEHLILGGDILAPLSEGAALALEVPAGSGLAPLDYSGRPAGLAVPWPGDPVARWATVDRATPARVAALVGEGGAMGVPEVTAGHRRVTIRAPHVHASVSWSGLPHALLWEELGVSQEAPWNGAVIALGIEPTSTPHGAGTGVRDGIVNLEPGARIAWWTALAVRWVAAS